MLKPLNQKLSTLGCKTGQPFQSTRVKNQNKELSFENFHKFPKKILLWPRLRNELIIYSGLINLFKYDHDHIDFKKMPWLFYNSTLSRIRNCRPYSTVSISG